MQPFKSLARTAALLGLSVGLGLGGLANAALADDSQLYGVKDIDVSQSGGAPEVTVKNIAGSHKLSDLHLALQGSKVAVGVSGYVDCTGVQIENFTYREGYFLSGAAFGIGRSSLLMSHVLPDSSDINHTSAMGAHSFQMPLSLLANPQIHIDPVAIVLAAADKAPSKIAYLRQNHVITVKIPLRWEAKCASYTRNKITKKTIVESPETSYLTKDVSLKIVYQGDPQLFEVNAQIVQGGQLPHQLQAGDQPFKITSMTFQPNMPHYVGACPAARTIRVNYQGQGQGQIRIRVNDGSTTIYQSSPIAFDSKHGKQHHDFQIEIPKASKFDLNKTVVHNLRVYVRGKGASEQVWPASYQFMSAAVWHHRCTPQLNPSLGGTSGGIKNGGTSSNTSPVLKLKPIPAKPATPTIKRLQ